MSADTSTDATLEKRIYTYDKSGRVRMVVREIAGDVDPENDDNQWYRGTQLVYSTQGKIWLARSMRWQLEEVPNTVGEGTHPEATHLEFQASMEYRYDGGRQRYMVRPRNVNGSVIEAGKWYDYAGQSIHGDYTVALDQSNGAVVTEKVAHEPGVIDYDYTAAAGERQTYLHGNLVGTTEATTSADPGQGGTGVPPVSSRAVYTAFGERVYQGGTGVPPVGGRYGYAGAWGYQAAGTEQCGPVGEEFLCDALAELGWLHVGERYYDPACGRFVQRDPIGIRGGANVYVYVGNQPVNSVDPKGLATISFPVGGSYVSPGTSGSLNVGPALAINTAGGSVSFEFDVLVSVGGGVGFGSGFSVGADIMVTSANSVNDLTGGGWALDMICAGQNGGWIGGGGYSGPYIGLGGVGAGGGVGLQTTSTVGVLSGLKQAVTMAEAWVVNHLNNILPPGIGIDY